MNSVKVPTALLHIISEEEDGMPIGVELELQGVLKLVVLLYLKKQQGCDVRG
jgi:hypothetical protein